jgi:hypothetical protein
MQCAGHVIVNGKTILVLCRVNDTQGRTAAHGITLKLRKTGKPGKHFSDESDYLTETPEKFQRILNGESVKL